MHPYQDFFEGTDFFAYEHFGAHLTRQNGMDGCLFSVYAPNAAEVFVCGEWNDWQGEAMERDAHGIYSHFSPDAHCGMLYQYRIVHADGTAVMKTDPYGFQMEMPPGTSSRIVDLEQYQFSDDAWMAARDVNYNKPMSIYEVHCRSWMRHFDGRWYSYRDLTDRLIPYLKEHHFTHVELLPLSEHPFDGSWGYQVSGYFAPTSRYGSPQDLCAFIDACHRENIGVILDFVPIHFVRDENSLIQFDGTPLYEYSAPDMAYNEWGSCNFNYYRHEVRSFLASAANLWLTKYHADGLRVDAVNNAIYWQGDHRRGENPGAITFLRTMNEGLHRLHPTAMLMAEDSSVFLKVTAPVQYGGLGFDYKWNMGWMHDTLAFFKLPPQYRRDAYHQLTFSMDYFYNELFLLPFSHDEVVHGKATILQKMWGDYEEKFAQCRALFLYMFTHPGKKLNFMGNEFGQFREWDETREQDWMLLDYPAHRSFFDFFTKMGELYCTLPALYDQEYNSASFEWVERNGDKDCVFAFRRRVRAQSLLIVLNLSDKPLAAYPLAYSSPCALHEILNTDTAQYGGSGTENDTLHTKKRPGKHPYALEVALAPLSGALFREEYE